MPLNNPLLLIPEGRPKLAGTAYPSISGIDASSVSTSAMTANQIRYEPIKVETPIVLDQITIEVTSQGAGGTTARLGIYNADIDWQPTSLVLDAGTVAVDSNGVKTISINQALPAGRYLLALNTDGTPTLRAVIGGNWLVGFQTALGASIFTLSLTVAQAYAAFLNTGVAWTTVANSSGGFRHHIFTRISTP